MLSGRVENNKAINCPWVFALGIIGANPDNLKSNLDKFGKGLEVGWSHLAEGEKNKNRLEWSRISRQLLSASPDSLKSTVDGLMEHPPSFDVSLGYMAIEQK